MAGHLLVQADARRIPLVNNSVDCVVTSPPYWGLRDYGVVGQLGLEPLHDCLGWAMGDPCGECWVCQMVAVFREVRRVLKPWGSCWVNLGDSYSDAIGKKTTFRRDLASLLPVGHQKGSGLRTKNLCGLPWRFALALQADGWWLRSEVIWAKPNPMPESVKDRPTKAHEQVFLLTKSPRYFYDHEAVREPARGKNLHDLTGTGHHAPGQPPHTGNRRSKSPDGWDRGNGAHGTIHRAGRSKGEPAEIRQGRSLRSVWVITPQPMSEDHFATFPEALVERCILASTSAKGNCQRCGRPWERVVEPEPILTQHAPQACASGWRPTCGCSAGEPVAAVILDPFVGSGTTCRVAERLGRKAIGLDLSMRYLAEIAAPRCAQPVQLGFVDMA